LGKFLLLIVVIAAAWWLARGLRRSDTRAAPEAAPEQMVNCAHCGLYLPQGEAIREGDRFFCCAEHRRLAA